MKFLNESGTFGQHAKRNAGLELLQCILRNKLTTELFRCERLPTRAVSSLIRRHSRQCHRNCGPNSRILQRSTRNTTPYYTPLPTCQLNDYEAILFPTADNSELRYLNESTAFGHRSKRMKNSKRTITFLLNELTTELFHCKRIQFTWAVSSLIRRHAMWWHHCETEISSKNILQNMKRDTTQCKHHLNITLLTTCQLTDCGDISLFSNGSSKLTFLSDSATCGQHSKRNGLESWNAPLSPFFYVYILNKTDYGAVLYSERRRNNITSKCKLGRRNVEVLVCTWSWTVTDWTRGGDGKFRTMMAKLGLSFAWRW